jgi:hypothetical protein
VGRIKDTKPIMMLGGNGDIFHASAFSDLYPSFGIEILWVELIG